jgi:hypothetical protein
MSKEDLEIFERKATSRPYGMLTTEPNPGRIYLDALDKEAVQHESQKYTLGYFLYRRHFTFPIFLSGKSIPTYTYTLT